MAKITLTNQADFNGLYGATNNPVTFSSNAVSTNIIQGLTATKTADKEYWVDGPLTYTVTIQNNSGDTFTGGVLTDVLDTAHVALDTAFGIQINGAATTDFINTDGTLKINLTEIRDGETVTVTFRVTQTNPQ